jgi:hypothetical protein
MSGTEAKYVRLAGYVWAKGRTCPVQTDLAVPRKFRNHPKN